METLYRKNITIELGIENDTRVKNNIDKHEFRFEKTHKKNINIILGIENDSGLKTVLRNMDLNLDYKIRTRRILVLG